jgi:hypothetical protein
MVGTVASGLEVNVKFENSNLSRISASKKSWHIGAIPGRQG